MLRKFLEIFCVFAVLAVVSGCGSDNDNDAPLADAGPDQNVVTGSLVTLDGSASSDADGDPLSYQWELVSLPAGSSAVLSETTLVRPTFTADVDGVYEFQLIVNDGKRDSPSDTVVVTAATLNSVPVAAAGPDQNVFTGSLVTLDGGASSDADGDPLTYAWSLASAPTGSSATLLNPTVVGPTFTPDLDGSYVVQLIVNDGQVESAADTVVITAATQNSAPVAVAGSDRTVATGSLVTLDGSASSDADNDPLTYAWSFVSRPDTSSATLSAPAVVGPTFTPDLDGDYVLQLIVDDGQVASVADTVVITATQNTSPDAIAGPDQMVPVGSLVTLYRSGGTDADGDLLTYSWSLIARPDGSNAALSAADVAAPTITVDLIGEYVLQLTVNDGLTDSAADTVTITAGDPLLLTGTWTTPALLQTDVGNWNSSARAAVNSSGDGVVSWSQGDFSPFAANMTLANPFDAVAGTWLDPAAVAPISIGATDTTPVSNSAPGIGNDGQAVVARAVAVPGGPDRIYVFDFDPVTASWSGGTPLSTAPEGSVDCQLSFGGYTLHASSPQLRMDGSGEVIVAWQNLCSSSYGWYTNIYVSLYDPQMASWRAGQRLDNYFSESHSQAVAIGRSGQAAVAWVQEPPSYPGAPGGLYVSTAYGSPGPWLPVALATAASSGLFRAPDLCIDDSGNVHVVWWQNEQLFWSRFDMVSQNWSTPVRIDEAATTVMVGNPKVACNGQGNLLVTWEQDQTNLVSRRYLAASDTWEAPVVVANGSFVNANVGLGVDAAGNGLSLYRNNTGHPSVQRFNAQTGTWGAAERLDVSEAWVREEFMGFAVNASGQTLITWIQSPDDAGLLEPLPYAVRLE